MVKVLEKEEMFTRLPSSFEPGYLGKGGKGKVALLDSVQESTPEIVLTSALPACDDAMSTLSELLTPCMKEAFGFEIYSRTNLMLRLSFSGLEDEAKYLPPLPVGRDADAFLMLMGRKKVGVLQYMGPGSAELTLLPKAPEFPESSITLKPGSLVVFLTDQYDYDFKPTGEALLLQSFFLTTPMDFKLDKTRGGMDLLPNRPPQGAPPPAGESIVVKGLASRDPCAADMHEKLWSAVRHGGTDGFIEIPYTRFDIDVYVEYTDQNWAVQTGKSYCRHQGHVDGLEIFDHNFFVIPEQEAFGMDPEQRVIMETGWLAMSDAGYQRDETRKNGAHLGVFVGISSSDWRDVCKSPSANGVPETFIANRFSCDQSERPEFHYEHGLFRVTGRRAHGQDSPALPHGSA
jgi:polyketide synthase-associated protein